MNKPLLFLIFNRPYTTQVVFDVFKNVKPRKLYIAADGPREYISSDIEKCKAVRGIVQNINWDCDVKTLFREENLGCKLGVSSAIDWFFDHEEEGIILEDDCVPDHSFFRYCEEMLEMYRNNKSIYMISGDNYLMGKYMPKYSYYFSKYSFIWGWATWRRAWENYDVNILSWPRYRNSSQFNHQFRNVFESIYWKFLFDLTYEGKIDTWDYQWFYTMFINNTLSICPNVNLVTNIGFDDDSTHTKGKRKYSNINKKSLNFPLLHPVKTERDQYADRITYNIFFTKPRIKGKLINLIKYGIIENIFGLHKTKI